MLTRNMLDECPHSTQTICEIHRQMYRVLMERDPEDPVIQLLWKAFIMAKKMNNRLRKYKDNYDEDWWEVHKLDGGELDATQTD